MKEIPENREIRLSRFGHIFQRDDIHIIIHSLTSTPIIYSSSLSYLVEKMEKTTTLKELRKTVPVDDIETLELLVAQLIDAKLLVPVEYDESEYMGQVRLELIEGTKFNILFLLLTESCNLRCSYCFIEGSKPEGYKDSVMSEETATLAVDRFVEWGSSKDKKSIVFYGGEPLLNRKALVAALDRVNTHIENGTLPKDIEKILITNGTLIDQSLLETIKMYNIFPYISIDGPEEVHNSQRPFANGNGSYEDAVRGLNLVRSLDIEPGVSITVTEEMVERMPEILEWLVVNLGVKAVGFNMLESIPGRQYFSEEYGDKFAKAVVDSQHVCEKYKVYEERAMRKIKQFAKQEIYVYDCAACGEQITVAPDGQVGVCQGFVGTREFFSGNVHDTSYNPNTDPIFQEWSTISPINRDECMFCPGLGICGGGCPRNPYLNEQNIHGLDPRFCTHTLKMLEWIVFHLYDQINENE